MFFKMKKYAVIVAGGSGQRMGTDIPKQFLLLAGKTLLWHSVNAFLNAFDDINIILVLPAEHMAEGAKIADGFQSGEKIQVTTGGATRFHSVRNGLQLVTGLSIVFVHDGVRCLVNKALIQRCYEQAVSKGNAV